MLGDRFVGEVLERLARIREHGIESLRGRDLGEDGLGELVLLGVRKARSGPECLFQRFGHELASFLDWARILEVLAEPRLMGEAVGSRDVPESDWKTFRELRDVALQQFCQRVFEEIEPLCRDSSRRHHERYLDLFRLVRDRDEELAQAFNDPRRSRMIAQLVAIHARGLLEPDELARFSARTRDAVELLVKELSRTTRDGG